MIDNLKELEELIILLKRHDVPSFKCSGLEITLNKATPNNLALKEEPSPRRNIGTFEDPDAFSHLPMRIKMRGESNDND